MKKTVLILMLICIICVLFAGCNTTKQPLFTPSTYPKVDGSTATIPLSEQFAADSMGLKREEAATYIKHNTTHNAYVNLIEKKADIIFVTSPSEEEYELAKQAGVEFEIYPVVNEGFVFMVNKSNPVSSLTQQQIKDIYSGKINNWKEMTGRTGRLSHINVK
jgi:phosphate transport system substrate-binding protein